MTANAVASVALSVPRLIEDPVVASGCCATLAEDIITEELAAWPGVDAVLIEQTRGQVIVLYDPDRIGLETICEALEAIDYPVTSDPVNGFQVR